MIHNASVAPHGVIAAVVPSTAQLFEVLD